MLEKQSKNVGSSNSMPNVDPKKNLCKKPIQKRTNGMCCAYMPIIIYECKQSSADLLFL